MSWSSRGRVIRMIFRRDCAHEFALIPDRGCETYSLGPIPSYTMSKKGAYTVGNGMKVEDRKALISWLDS